MEVNCLVFCYQSLFHKRSLVCVRTSVDVFHNLCDLSIFIQGHTGSWLVWLGNECERCWTEHLSHQRCGLFLQKRMSYISATIVLGFLLAAIPLSLIYTRISLPTTCWLDIWIRITGSQFTVLCLFFFFLFL